MGATILGFKVHGTKFFSLLVPAGCPLGLLPLLVLIEFISYVSRSVSLGLRLAANITAGHILLSILSSFTFNIMVSGFFFFIIGLLPLLFITAFCGLEVAISLIQAQVFVVLTASYIKDALDLHGDDSEKKVGASSNLYTTNLSSNKRFRRVYSRSFSSKGRSFSTISSVSKGSSKQLHPWFITGFADAESCFYIDIRKASDCKTG